jgi:WD40 repeat protein
LELFYGLEKENLMARHVTVFILLAPLVFAFNPSSFVYAAQTYQEIMNIGQGTLADAVWRPDGNAILANSSQGIWLYTPAFENTAHIADIQAAIYSPDSNFIAGIGMLNDKVSLWDAAGTNHMSDLAVDASTRAIAFSPDGKFLAGSSSQGLWIWSLNTQEIFQSLPTSYEITSFAWNYEGNRIALSGVDRVQIWDVFDNRTEMLDLPAIGQQRIYKATWSNQENILAVATVDGLSSSDNSLQIWDVTTAKLLHIIQAGRILDLDWHPTDLLLATAIGRYDTGVTTGPSVQVWNALTGALNVELNWYTRDVTSVQWNTDGTQILTVAADNTARIVDWPPEATTTQPVLAGFANAVTSLAWNETDTEILSGHEDGSVRIWDANTGDPASVLLGNEAIVWSVGWNAQGDEVISSGADYTVRTWDVNSTSMSLLYKHEQTNFYGIPGVLSVAWSVNGKIASGGSDGTTRIFENGSDKILQENNSTVFSVHWQPAGTQLVIANGTIELWDSVVKQYLDTLKCNSEGIWVNAIFSPDGTKIAATTNIGNGCIWDVQTHQALKVFNGLNAPLIWSLDSTQIAGISSIDNSAINVIGVETGEVDATIVTGNNVRSLAWSIDGTKLASGSQNGIIQIWGTID